MTTTTNHQKPIYPHDWWSIAYQAKEAAEWTCKHCPTKQGDDPHNNITVHHRDHNTFNNENYNLLVLCQRCHLAEERKYRLRLRADRQYNQIQTSGQLILNNFTTLLFPQLNIAELTLPQGNQGSGIS